MDLQSVINSRYGIGFGLTIGRIIPPVMGYWLARKISSRIAQRSDSGMVRAVRANQWVIRGENLPSQDLDEAVLDTIQSTARCQYDLYHNIQNPSGINNLFRFSPAIDELIEQRKDAKDGLLVVGLHVNNLDIGFIALSQKDVKAMGISVPQPGGGYQWQNDIREKLGFNLIPASKKALRAANEQLKNGGTVVTGIDRPIEESKYRPEFFGRPASLPVLHIVLALKFNIPVYVAATVVGDDGLYYLDISKPIYMESKPDRYSSIMYNAEVVLEVAEEYIRQVPQQWAMYYPVWPEVIDKVP